MRFLILCLALCLQLTTFAQLPPACNGSAPAIACDIACINCNFNGFSGSTAGYPSSIATDFCGTVENSQWLGFIAGITGPATFTIVPSNCVNGDGLQVALYTQCDLPPIACDKGEFDNGSMPVSITIPLDLGRNYFLLIDGFAGDQCDFTVSISPNEAVYQPPLDVAAIVTGPTAVCPGSTFDYLVQPVSGAGAYIWTGPPGVLFDSIPSPATILADEGQEVAVTFGTQGGQICVQAANSCAVNPPCSAFINVTMLGDDARPDLLGDTLASLSCTGNPLRLNAAVGPLSNAKFEWTTDSLGHFVSGTNTYSPLVDSVGTYTLVVSDESNGCTASLRIRVTLPDLPTDAQLTTRDITCFGLTDGSIVVGAVTGGTEPYLYQLDKEDFVALNQFTNVPPGNHTLTIQDALGCEWDSTFHLIEPFELLVDLGSDSSVQLGETVVLWDTFMVNYPERILRWNLTPPDNGDTTICAGCPSMPIRSFRYSLSVADENGCTASDTRIVNVRKDRRVYIPNIFTPVTGESSGNASFGLSCGDDVTEVRSFRVFDRWGHFVHERTDFMPDDTGARWDGKVENRLAPSGVYVYVAEVLFKDGESVVFKGDVTLVR